MFAICFNIYQFVMMDFFLDIIGLNKLSENTSEPNSLVSGTLPS